MGRRGSFRRLAGVAVPAGRTDAAVAQRLCLVRAWFRCFGPFSRFRNPDERHPLRRGFFVAYLCGFLWYLGNCYWVRDTMSHYGDMPPLAPTLLLIGFSLVLGLYFGLFGLGVVLVRRATGSTRLALAFAPFLWTGLELAAARITSVPWDQLGYSQVDNALINQLAPWTGVYGISFVLVAVNALLAGGLLLGREIKNPLSGRWAWAGCGALAADFRIRRRLCSAAQARSHRDRRPDSAESGCGLREQLARAGVGSPHRRIHAPGRRAMQDLHRRHSADRRAHGRNHLPALSHASRSRGLAGVARAVR